MATRILRRQQDLLDVDPSAIGNDRTPVYRALTGKHEYEDLDGGNTNPFPNVFPAKVAAGTFKLRTFTEVAKEGVS